MITVIGGSNTDFSIKTQVFPSVGETVLGGEFFISCGGKGANQAACIAKMGGKVNFISSIGLDNFGDISIDNLKKLGVNTSCVKRDKFHHSGAALIIIDENGRNLIAVSPGSNSFLKTDDILKRVNFIKQSTLLLLQLEIPAETVKAAVYIAKRLGKITVLNPAPAFKLSGDILSRIDILIPNETEVSELTGKAVATKEDLIESANLLLKAGAGCVIITLGKKGALLVRRNKSEFFKAKKVDVVDTTCAGDAFCGSFTLGLDNGKSIEDAIEFANCVAALTVTKRGAQTSLPTLSEVQKCF